MKRFIGAMWLVGILGCGNGCREASAQGTRAPGKRQEKTPAVAEMIFDGKRAEAWDDYGWSDHAPDEKDGVAMKLSDYGGWILARPRLNGVYGGLTFRFHAPPAFGDFLEVRLDSSKSETFPRVRIAPEHRTDLAEGWSEVFIPMEQLNPSGSNFEQVVLRAFRSVGPEWVKFDKVGLTAFDPARAKKKAPLAAKPTAGAKDAKLVIDCRAPAVPINPLIYGIAFSARKDGKDTHQWELGASSRRWGGNPMSRYNWEIGNAWNTGSDWYFRNVNYTSKPDYTSDVFLNDNIGRKVQTALTVPMLGWVAKDTKSFAFPVSIFGPQRSTDPDHKDAGDGVGKDGKPLQPGRQIITSVEAPPESIGRWVASIREKDKARGRSVHQYILDNEPGLWHDTHRDVHPNPVSYDELLQRTIAYGTAVRKADPDAVIAGPAEWGWTNYFHSAVDSEAGVRLRPDRRAHGDVPLIAWYLQKLREHEQKTGVRILDIVDFHYYPQGKGMGLGDRGKTDPETAALRIRSTRSLWDPTYRDESWIDDTVKLIPRMKALIAENYPGRGISIGEYNFGAERHMSGGLAQAETLGRFGQHGVTSAFYWTYPERNSPAFWAFRAYRNYDGTGGRFLDYSLSTQAPPLTSVFASRDEAKSKIVAVALNFNPDSAVKAQLAFEGCGKWSARKMYQYVGDPRGFAAGPAAGAGEGGFDEVLPPYSMTVLELALSR